MSQANGIVKPHENSNSNTTIESPPSIDPLDVHEAEALRTQFSRTPRPYHHDGDEVRQDHGRRGSERGLRGGDVAPPSRRPTGDEPPGEQELGGNEAWAESTGTDDIPRRRQPRQEDVTPGSADDSESGTEADDERPFPDFGRALLAPTHRPSKGLKSGESDRDALLTPSQLDDEGRRRPSATDEDNYFLRRRGDPHLLLDPSDAALADADPTGLSVDGSSGLHRRHTSRTTNRPDDAAASPEPVILSAADARAEQEKLQRRRYAEFLRRSCEVALTGGIVGVVLCGRGVGRTAWLWRWELLAHLLAMVVLVLAYPVKLSIVIEGEPVGDGVAGVVREEKGEQEKEKEKRKTTTTMTPRKRFWQRFRVPASFDPATVLYPPLLPVLVALSVAPAAGGGSAAVVLPNVILGLASLPQRLFPRSSRLGGINAVHWFVSVIPLIVSENTTYISKVTPPVPYMLKSGPPQGLPAETLACLYPLHHALLNPLHYLTTTSLLVSELHLLSVALINLSLLSESPQAVILKACLWIGGLSLFITCNSLLSWNVTLARVPRWKLRRPGDKGRERRSLIDVVAELIDFRRAALAFKAAGAAGSDADEDAPTNSIKHKASAVPKLTTAGLAMSTQTEKTEPKSAVEPTRSANDVQDEFSPINVRRRNTVPERKTPPTQGKNSSTRKARRAAQIPWYLHLTPEQATNRKWFYAALIYSTIALLILGPVRIYVSKDALYDQEPISWAIFYLFGQSSEWGERLRTLRWLEPTISYVPPWDLNPIRIVFGMANWRLVTIAYWALVLAAGLLTVFSLTAYVEVDTRRKVFHGVMVAMFTPALYFDPCFCALALALVLAAFLLLEVLRAAHVPPLGNAIGRFVAPYVDGRDLRGPVVVSHIFLLIGCAVPLWFSLACFHRAGVGAWKGWEVAGNLRETAMLAGVICVGMGDAAASLIGRRIGRHKWPWVGGKSLEGSAAFAVAVTLGLMTAKWWLVNCGWKDAGQTARFDAGVYIFVKEWGWALLKAVFCACSASFMEAVLTGANDNVVVPIVLWLLVKGVRL